MSTTTAKAPPVGSKTGSAIWAFKDGTFTRNGEVMATIDPATQQPAYTEAGNAYRHVVAKRWKEKPKTKAAIAETSPPPGQVFTQSSTVATKPEDPYSSLTPDQRAAIVFLRKREGLDPYNIEARTKKPVKPDRIEADKSKAFIWDVLRFDPVAFVNRYGVVKLGKARRKVRERDPETNRMRKVIREESVALSKRKTHYTERLDSMALLREDDSDE